MTGLEFTEEMKGHVALGETDHRRGARQGEEDGTFLMFHLTIETGDVERFVADPDHEAAARGWVECEALGGRLPVEHGIFNLFVDGDGATRTRMLYRLFFADGAGHPLTLSGFKTVKDDPGLDLWSDTSTLYTRILRGHVEAAGEPTAEVVAAGVITIYLLDFAEQLTTFRTHGGSAAEQARALAAFGRLFLGKLWDVYGGRVERAAGVPPMNGRTSGRTRLETAIDAPPDRVWATLADLPSWSRWNPTLFGADSPAVVGKEVHMKLRLGRVTIPMRQLILVVEPGRELTWRSLQPVPTALDVVRSFHLGPLGDGRTLLVQCEWSTGFLAPLISRVIDKAVVRGYADLGRALADRVGSEG